MQLDLVIRDFLAVPRFAVLATIAPSGLPRQSVMWYDLLDDETILMNTAEGRAKLADLRRDPRASLCVADGYRYVTLIGRIELLDDQQRAQADILRLARRYVPEDEIPDWERQFRTQRRVTLLFRVERVRAHGIE